MMQPFEHEFSGMPMSMKAFLPECEGAAWFCKIYITLLSGMSSDGVLHSSDNDDLDLFQTTVPPLGINVTHSNLASPSSPPDPSAPNPQLYHPQHSLPQCDSSSQFYFQATQLFSIPLQLGAACRKVHSVLTGPKATRRAEEHGLVDAHGMREVWEDLDHCWREFDAMMRRSANGQGALDLEQFCGAWQVGLLCPCTMISP